MFDMIRRLFRRPKEIDGVKGLQYYDIFMRTDREDLRSVYQAVPYGAVKGYYSIKSQSIWPEASRYTLTII